MIPAQNHAPGWKERVWYKGFGMVLTIAMLTNTYLSSRVVVSVETQEKTTGTRFEKLQKTSDDTHTLVNANMGFQLKVGAVALRRNAGYSKLALATAKAENKNAAVILEAEKLAATDEEIAILAENLLAEHVARQATVDSGKKVEIKPSDKEKSTRQAKPSLTLAA